MVVVQFHAEIGGHLCIFGIGTQAHGEDHHVEIFFFDFSYFIHVADGVPARVVQGGNLGYLGFDESDTGVIFGPIEILLKIFAVGPDIQIENGSIQKIRAMLLGQHGFLDGCGAAHGRAVAVGPFMSVT